MIIINLYEVRINSLDIPPLNFQLPEKSHSSGQPAHKRWYKLVSQNKIQMVLFIFMFNAIDFFDLF